MNAELVQTESGQQFDQLAAAQQWRHLVGRQHGDPGTGAYRLQQQRGIVGADVAAHRHRQRTAIAVQLPQALADVVVGQAVVRGQVLRRGRRATRLQVRRRRAQHRAAGGQPPRDQAGVDLARDAHGQVHALLDQVHRAVDQQQLDARRRMACDETGHRPRQVALPERHAGGHPQRAVRLGIITGQLALQFFADRQHLPEARQRRLARPVRLTRRVVRCSRRAPSQPSTSAR